VPNVYKVTYPNGKVLVAQDRLDQVTYIESIANQQFLEDFGDVSRRDFIVRKEVLWESPDADADESVRQEIAWILRLHANDPAIGYNRWPSPDE